jgi:hypothetical protein
MKLTKLATVAATASMAVCVVRASKSSDSHRERDSMNASKLSLLGALAIFSSLLANSDIAYGAARQHQSKPAPPPAPAMQECKVRFHVSTDSYVSLGSKTQEDCKTAVRAKNANFIAQCVANRGNVYVFFQWGKDDALTGDLWNPATPVKHSCSEIIGAKDAIATAVAADKVVAAAAAAAAAKTAADAKAAAKVSFQEACSEFWASTKGREPRVAEITQTFGLTDAEREEALSVWRNDPAGRERRRGTSFAQMEKPASAAAPAPAPAARAPVAPAVVPAVAPALSPTAVYAAKVASDKAAATQAIVDFMGFVPKNCQELINNSPNRTHEVYKKLYISLGCQSADDAALAQSRASQAVQNDRLATQVATEAAAAKATAAAAPVSDKTKCAGWATKYGIVFGKTWGTAPANIREQWGALTCNMYAGAVADLRAGVRCAVKADAEAQCRSRRGPAQSDPFVDSVATDTATVCALRAQHWLKLCTFRSAINNECGMYRPAMADQQSWTPCDTGIFR